MVRASASEDKPERHTFGPQILTIPYNGKATPDHLALALEQGDAVNPLSLVA